MSKAKKNKMQQVTWIILLFEQEYSVKLSGVAQDEYTTFLGAFNYDASSESLLGEEDEDEDEEHAEAEENEIDAADPK
jgi:hypothetical protein